MTAPRRPLGTGPRIDDSVEDAVPSPPSLVERIAMERQSKRQPTVEEPAGGGVASRRALGTGAEER